jgi:hypothetical protein
VELSMLPLRATLESLLSEDEERAFFLEVFFLLLMERERLSL